MSNTKTIDLKGLVKMSEDEITAMTPEEATQLVDDLRHIRDVQRHLPGVKLYDEQERSCMSHRDIIEMILDVRQIAIDRSATTA